MQETCSVSPKLHLKAHLDPYMSEKRANCLILVFVWYWLQQIELLVRKILQSAAAFVGFFVANYCVGQTIFFSFTNYLQCFRRYGHIYFDFCYQQCEKSCKQTLTIPYNVQLNIIFKMQTCVYERKTKMALLPCICFSVKTSQFVSQ